jgi:hypothetical protein
MGLGRIATVVACVIAGLAVPQVAFGAASLTAHSCGSNCGSLETDPLVSSGTLNVTNGNGAEWGSISSGTVKVQDRSYDGHQSWSLSGCDKRYKDPKNKAITVCQANNKIYFNVSTLWSLWLNGTHVDAGVVATGHVYIKGSGRYKRNGAKSWTRWPSGGTSFSL